jgi:hypothetical protein
MSTTAPLPLAGKSALVTGTARTNHATGSRCTLSERERHDRHERGSECGFMGDQHRYGPGPHRRRRHEVGRIQKAPDTAGRGLGRRLQPGHSEIRGIHRDGGRSGNFLPAVLDIPSRLALTAGTAGLIVVMPGAAVVHARRREPGMIVLNIALLALAAVAVWGRPCY